jgi:hypothetical protein
MPVDGRLVFEQAVLLRSMSHCHDVYVVELGSALTPIAMGENLMTPDFTARLDFAPSRNRPMKQRIEARDTRAGLAGLDVFKESRKSTDELANRQRFGDGEKFLERYSRLSRTSVPDWFLNFLGGKLAF